ncbi:MAG: DUF4832 domain-containing protein [Clostridiales bacterium]|nr:DUF4832 domain-containing protein [Clostridiales bacterium]
MAAFKRPLAWALLAALLFLPCMDASAFPVSVLYPASEDVLVNPYTGNVVWANDKHEHEQPFTLVYADLTWAEFEPEQGVYDFYAFEKENRFVLWRAKGKHVILRFVMDMPGDKKHRDIPDWLYDATGGDGTEYNTSYGKGFSPNYENETLIQAHAEAIAALGERYGDDFFIAFVELGSLGHWGEWHLHHKLGLMPAEDVRNLYVLPYIDAFPNAYLLMRRPFAIAADYGFGLFNDTAGEYDSTVTWLTWIQSGGDYDSPDGRGALVPMPDAWQTAPVGGELSTSIGREALLRDYFDQTCSLFKKSHTSWIGPGSFSDIRQNGRDQAALDEILRTIGYRLRVTQSSIEQTALGGLLVTLTWINDGIAPFYFPWQPALRVTDALGNKTVLPLDLRLIDILPGESVSVSATIAPQNCAYRLWAGILNPATGEPAVALAMDVNQSGLWYELARLQAP